MNITKHKMHRYKIKGKVNNTGRQITKYGYNKKRIQKPVADT